MADETIDVRWCETHSRFFETGFACPECEGEAHAADYEAAMARMRDVIVPTVAERWSIVAIVVLVLAFASAGAATLWLAYDERTAVLHELDERE